MIRLDGPCSVDASTAQPAPRSRQQSALRAGDSPSQITRCAALDARHHHAEVLHVRVFELMPRVRAEVLHSTLSFRDAQHAQEVSSPHRRGRGGGAGRRASVPWGASFAVLALRRASRLAIPHVSGGRDGSPPRRATAPDHRVHTRDVRFSSDPAVARRPSRRSLAARCDSEHGHWLGARYRPAGVWPPRATVGCEH